MAPIFDCPISNGTFVMTSILLADHHSLFRAGMVKLIDAIGGFTLAAEVDTARAAVDYVAEYTPDILLLEMGMPDMSGFEVLRRIQRMHLGTRVVALTNWTTQPMPLHAMRAGIDGYLGKELTRRNSRKRCTKYALADDTSRKP